MLRALALTLLAVTSLCFHNPGVVIQVPTNLSLPVVQPALPQPIPPLVLQKLQLNNMALRTIDYEWKLEGEKFVIVLKRTVISFEWLYGRDEGLGTFEEQYCDLVVRWQWGVDGDGRFTVDVQNAAITDADKRHSIKVHLGGKVPETLVVIITNEILNNAKSAFRSVVKNVMGKVVEALTQPLRQDLQVVCPQKNDQCIYINTTLVAKPTIADGIQFIQVNGGVYKTGQKSGFLDPSESLLKVNSSLITVQIHQQLLQQVASLYDSLSPILETINATDISSVLDINSQTLTVVFPGMRDFAVPRPVLFALNISDIKVELAAGVEVGLLLSGELAVRTQSFVDGSKQQEYVGGVQAQAKVTAAPVVNGFEAGARVDSISIDKLQFKSDDIRNNKVVPAKLTKHLSSLLSWAKEGVNGVLNQKIIRLALADLKVSPKLNILSHSVAAEISFIESSTQGQPVYAEA